MNNQNNNTHKKEFPSQGNFSASTNERLNRTRNQNAPTLNNRTTNAGFGNGIPNQNKIDQAKQELVKEGAKTAANAAAGPLGGAAVDALSKTELGQKALSNVSNQLGKNPLKTPGPLRMLNLLNNKSKEEEVEGEATSAFGEIKNFLIPFFAGGGATGCLIFITIFCSIVVILSPLFYMKDLIEDTASFGEKLGNFLTFRGWCGDAECTDKEKINFYEKVEDEYDYYLKNYGVKLNTSLIIATLTYSDPFLSLNDSITDEDSSDVTDFKKSEKKVKDLAKHMVSVCCTENGQTLMCDDGETNYSCDTSKEGVSEGYKLDTERYRAYLEDEFIRKFYYNNKNDADTDLKVKSTVDEIFERVEYFENNFDDDLAIGYKKVYAYCPGVTVKFDETGETKTYDLETYVAGVVCSENYCDQGEEALKAQAIAARTFVLSVTDNCSKSIINTQDAQVFHEVNIEAGRPYAEATEGLVLLYDDKIFTSEYDSYCYNDKSCSYGTENGKMYVEYTKLPNGEKHKVYLSDTYKSLVAGGHGRGMSQVASYELAANGYNYEEILKYFYSDGVKISKMVNTLLAEFSSSSTIIKDVDELLIRSNLYEEIGMYELAGEQINLALIYSQSASNIGQCVWYARSRALELIFYSNMSDEEKLQAYKYIQSSMGNGGDWYKLAPLNNFEKSTDYTKPRPGAILSWSSSTSKGASHNYGHVAIVESVDYENETIVISEGWHAGGPDGADTWENVRYSSRTMGFSEIYNYKSGYTFNGYVYILG